MVRRTGGAAKLFAGIVGIIASAMILPCTSALQAADIPPVGVDLVDLTSPDGTAFSIEFPYVGKAWLENCSYKNAFDDGRKHDRSDRVIIKATELDIGYEFTIATNVNAYSIILPNTTDDVPARAPKTWIFEGSNDMAEWKTLDPGRNETDWNQNEKRFFRFKNDENFKYYRIYVKSVNGDEYFQISELEFYHIKEEYRPPVVDEPDTSVYSRYVDITASGVPEGTELENFPVLVRLSAETVAGFRLSDVKRVGHGDIVFVDSHGKYLPHEIDTWDEAEGVALVWVKLGLLKKGETFRMYYGNEDADAGNEAKRVWSEYAGVWHFSNGYMYDSNDNGFLSRLDKNAQLFSRGMVGGGVTNGVAYCNHPFGKVENIDRFAVSGWINPLKTGATARIFSTKSAAGNSGFELIHVVQEKGEYMYLRGDGDKSTLIYNVASPASVMPVGSWMHYAGMVDGENGTIFTNGAALATGKVSPVTGIDTDYLAFGGSAAGVDLFQGAYDELRVFDGIPPDGWLQAEYDSVSREDYLTYSPVSASDASLPLVGIPSVVRNSDGSFTVAAAVSAGTGEVCAVFSNGVDTVTVELATADEDFPKMYTGAASGLAPDKTYRVFIVGTGRTGMTDVSEGPSVYSGPVSVAAGGNADEDGLTSGYFVVTRADTWGDLVIEYEVSGTAVHGVTFERLPGKVVIPDGENSATVTVLPKVHALLNEDSVVILTITGGLYEISAAPSAEITVENLLLDEENNYWIATADGKASAASNWSRGVPVETDTIVFDGRITVADCEWDAGVNGLPVSVGSWIQNEDYTGRVIIPTTRNGDFTCFTVTGDALLNGGEWWRRENLKEDGNSAKVWLNISVGGDLTVGSGFTFNGEACGFPKQKGPSPGGENGSSGGAHGGLGGGGIYGNGTVYGDYRNPTELGSGQYGSTLGGGGAIILDVSGDFTLEGCVNANAGDGGTGSGQSGGSVWIKARTLSGVNGSITADGGSPSNKRAGGGAGRISIQLSEPTWSQTKFFERFTGKISAIGGFDTKGGDYVRVPGASGTVYIETAADNGKGTMRLFNGNWSNQKPHNAVTLVANGVKWDVSQLTMGDNGRVGVSSGGEVHVPSFASITGDNSQYCLLAFIGGTVSSDIKHDKLVADGFDIENIGTSSFAEHTLVIPDDSSLKLGGDFTVGALVMGRTRLAAGDYTAAKLSAVYANVSGNGVIHVRGITDGFRVVVR